ncbi:hypothetical protein Pcinc_025414 [Petrolisthes cinctipes]|uniref:Uncharacterized protein n=1 Tax=Petrolisthes cinctipes TaxID=88211 RepID=A0AAE1F9Y6_PETCI|nr:hypothetical protein Pcinc_025414 [Petrolisthes cinctipes]
MGEQKEAKNYEMESKEKKDMDEEDVTLNGHVAEFAQSFSAHGFGKIYGSRQWLRRGLWVCVCLFMLGYGSYQCYKVMAEYLTYPKKVTIGVEEDTIAEFPAVTVCNLNPLPARQQLTEHPMWGAFVALEENNKDPVCEGLSDTFDFDSSEFGEDYYYYVDYEDGGDGSDSGSDYDDTSDYQLDTTTDYTSESDYQSDTTTDFTSESDYQSDTTTNDTSESDYQSDTTDYTSESDYQSDTTTDYTSESYYYQSETTTDYTSESYYYQSAAINKSTDSTDYLSSDSTSDSPSDSTAASTTDSTTDSDSITGSTTDSESTTGFTTNSDSTTDSTTDSDSTTGFTTDSDSTTGFTTDSDSTTDSTTDSDSTTGSTTDSDSTTGSTTDSESTTGFTTDSDSTTDSTTDSDSTTGSITDSDSTTGFTTDSDSTTDSTTDSDSTTGSTTDSDSTTGSTTDSDSTTGSTTDSESTTGFTTDSDSTTDSTTDSDSTTGSTTDSDSTTDSTTNSDSTTDSTTNSNSTTDSTGEYDSTADSTSDSPATASTSDSPATDSTSNSPAIASTSDSPATDSTSDSPATDSTSDSPATDSTSDSPATDSTSDSPATDSTSDDPTTNTEEDYTETDGTDYTSTTYDGDQTTTGSVRRKRWVADDSTTTTNNNNPDGSVNRRHQQQLTHMRNKNNNNNNIPAHAARTPKMDKIGREKYYKMLHASGKPKMALKRSKIPISLLKKQMVQGKHTNKGRDNEKEEKIMSTLLPDGSRHLPKSTSSDRSQVTDFATFTKMYSDKFQTPQRERPKRATGQAAAGKEMDETHRNTRELCSIYYRYFHHLKSVRTGVVMEGEAGKMDDNQYKCPIGNYKERISFNPLCRLEIVCDNYGCYDYDLKPYTEVTKISEEEGEAVMKRCPSCAKGKEEECWQEAWFTSWETGYLSLTQVEDLFKSSHTPDLSDIMGVFSPSVKDLANYSIRARDFVRTKFHIWNSDEYGRCYTYNSAFRRVRTNKEGNTAPAKIEKTSSSGPRSGLRLTMNMKADDSLALLSPDLGARIIVHSPHVVPFPEEQGFNVSPGFTSSVSVTKRCRKQCVEHEYWRSCQCYWGKNPSYEGDTDLTKPPDLCSPFNVTQKVCMDMVLFNYQQRKLECDCPPPCSETTYVTQATASEENRAFYTIVQNMKKTSLGDDLCSKADQSTVRIHIYLDTLSYEKIVESPAYTWDTLISNFGGSLGLFLGMSIVTMVELMEFLADLMLWYFLWKSNRNQHHQNHQHQNQQHHQPANKSSQSPPTQHQPAENKSSPSPPTRPPPLTQGK